MDVRPIKTAADYRAALDEINSLMGAAKDTPEGDRLYMLATLVEAYEAAIGPKQWSTRVVDAGDGSGDCILLLPQALCTLMSWTDGVTVNVSVSEAGELVMTPGQQTITKGERSE